MASGSISGSYRGYTLRTDWSSTIDIPTNKSTVTCNHYLVCGTSWNLSISSRTNTCVCGGDSKNFTSAAINTPGNQTITLGTTTHEVSHEANGKKTATLTTTFKLQGSISGVYVEQIVATGDIVLDDIPRISTIKTDTTGWESTNIDSGFHIGVQKYYSGYYNALKVYYNKTTTGFTLLKTVQGINDGSVITFTSSELNTIYGNVTGQTCRFYFVLNTYSDSTYQTQIGYSSTAYLTGSFNLVKPTFNNFTYIDMNSTTTALTGNSYYIIRGYSTLRIYISTSNKATAQTRQTSMSHYIADGQTLTYSSTSDVYINRPNYSSDNVSVYAVDKRGTPSDVVNKSFVTLDKYVDYTDVTKNDNQSYSRSQSGIGEFVTLTFSGKWWGDKKFGPSYAVTNSLSAIYRYRVAGSSTWSSDAPITLTLEKENQSDTYYTKYSFNGLVNGDLANNGFNVSNSYDIMVIVSDRLSWVTFNFSVHSGEPAIALYGNKVALGRKYDETLGGIQLWGDIYANGTLISSDSNS